MRILLINDHAGPRGGAEINLRMLQDSLRKRGHDARLFASTAGLNSDHEAADYTCFGTTSPFRTLLQTANPFAYFRLRRVLREFQPDVVYAKIFLTQLSPLILPLLKNIPSLHNVCWYRVICPKGTKLLPDETVCRLPAGSNCYQRKCLPFRDWAPLMLQRRLYRRWRNSFDLVLAYSDSVQRRLEDEGYTNVRMLTYGFAPAYAAVPSSLSTEPLIAFAGRLVPEKGVHVLLNAFSHVAAVLPSARLLIAGEGPEEGRLKQMAGALTIADRISFTGFIAKETLEGILSPAWVQAIPSLWEEPFGNVAVEAMMRGTAVVAARSGGLAEIIEDRKTGLLVTPGDTEDLARALLSLLKEHPLRDRLVANARKQAAEKYDLETYLSCIESLLQTLASRNQQAHA